MITDLDYILKQRPIAEALKGGLTPAKFRDALNFHIHGYGEEGYEDAERMNLRVDKRYDTSEAQELLRMIKESRETDEILIREIPEIPYGIAQDLRNKVSGDISKMRNCSYKYGALKGFELVGFLGGEPSREFISIGGLFVREKYCHQGLASKMFAMMYQQVRDEGFKGMFMSNASWKGQDALRRFHYSLSKKGIETNYGAGFEDLRNWADLGWGDVPTF